jgi:hypothetical protein
MISSIFLSILGGAPAASLPNVVLTLERPGASRSAIAALGGGGLEIHCPDTAKFECNGSSDPSETGTPTVTGACPGEVVITHSDQLLTVSGCGVDRFDEKIWRTWTATDSCGNTDSCTQEIDIIKTQGFLDIKPTSCPNPFELNSGGSLSMGILGTPTFDVHTIIPESIQIWTRGCDAGPVMPVDWSFEDVATPLIKSFRCECHTAGPDGILDLRLKFSKAAMRTGLHLNNYPSGTFVQIFLGASLTNGCGFIASDCVRVQ